MNIPKVSSAVDKAVVDSLVDEMMQGHGLKYFPDFIERRIYTNVITLGLRLIDSLIGQTKLVLFGHEITVQIRPEPIVIE